MLGCASAHPSLNKDAVEPNFAALRIVALNDPTRATLSPRSGESRPVAGFHIYGVEVDVLSRLDFDTLCPFPDLAACQRSLIRGAGQLSPVTRKIAHVYTELRLLYCYRTLLE